MKTKSTVLTVIALIGGLSSAWRNDIAGAIFFGALLIATEIAFFDRTGK